MFFGVKVGDGDDLAKCLQTSSNLGGSSSDLEPRSSGLEASSSDFGASSQGTNSVRDEAGYLVSDQLQLPVIDSLDALAIDFRQQLIELASKVRIPEYPPTHSDNMRPPIPGYPPTCDALP